MRRRDRPNFGKNTKLVKTTTIAVALLVAAIMIISSIPTVATPGNTTKMNKIDTETELDEIHSTGLAPRGEGTPLMATDINSGMAQAPIQEGYIMYMEHAVSGGGAELFSIDTEDPGTIVDDLGSSDAGNFMAGGTYGCDGVWYGIEYGSGILWGIDIYTGDMWVIGGGGTGMNGLAFDPVTNCMYGSSDNNYLYEIDPDTGEQEQIGPFGGGVLYMIGMAFDSDGILYGWDLSDRLWTIDTDTGEATEVGPLGININFAQDGDFHRESDQLYLTAYTTGGMLYKCDKTDGSTELVGALPSSWECTASVFENLCVPPEHDIGVKSILKPTESGHAIPEMEMELLVKNYGNNTETFDAQMEIIKCESSGNILLEEDFSGTEFPPEGWETDYWDKSFTNYASGESPEARAYKYNYGGQTYDNYIQTKPFDATGWEKLLLDFRFAADLYYPQYCNFFVKYRKNETSPWKDVTPWDNPLNEQKEGDFYTIDCYGFGEELGENFSIQFSFVGYYYYFNYFYLDDVSAEGCGGCAEYAELVEDLTLDPGEEMTVVFPGWPPSEWQNESFQDAWEKYPVHGFVILDGDLQPRNDNKWILLELYYPFFYDIEITEIGSPSEGRSIPAQTFDVEATITNVGQFPSCCIGIDVEIGEPTVLSTMVEETEWDTTGWPYYYIYGPGYGSGWRDEHKQITYYYGWQYRNGNQAGGDAPEAYLPYYYCRADYVFMSAQFDSSEYQSLQLEFLMYVNHYSGSGLYAIEAGYSHDGETWYAAWHEEPSANGDYEVSVPITGGSETTYIGFWIKGNPYYFNYIYMDNVEVKAMGYDLEWTDFMCQGDDLIPGESRVFDFDQWTPEFLAEETSGEKNYIVAATIDVTIDQDPGNNIMVNPFTLEYWHDVGIDRVTSPADSGRGDLLWDNGDTDGTNGYSILGSPKRTLLDDFEMDETWDLDEIRTFMIAGPVNDWEVGIWSDDDGDPGELILGPSVDIDFSIEYTGRTWFGYPEWEVTYVFDPITIDAGRYWIEMWSGSGAPNAFMMIHAAVWGSECWINYADLGFKPGSQQFGAAADLNFQLYGEAGGPPGISTYIQAGTKTISAVAKNYGTFQELDLTCYAEIWEYITDPENGTLQYEDEEIDIDLDTPLGGEVPLTFNDFTFAYEGRYGLFLDMPDDDDDSPGNNDMKWGIGVDGTDPESDHALDPTEPDGENGWYVNDLEVTLTAFDPKVADVSSGADMIKYKVNDGPEQTIDGDEIISGTFLITQADDQKDVKVEYWAIDNVGNVEDSHTFYIDMDQTDPTIDLIYEATNNEGGGWLMTFNATAIDLTSGMERVEFFLNDGKVSTVTGPGPYYSWSFVWHDDYPVAIRADAYDVAGNMASDIVEDPDSHSNSYNQNMQQQTIKLLKIS